MIVSDTIRLFDEEDFSEDYPTSKVLEAVAYTFGIDPDRLRAIAEAERDGRLVVLPVPPDSLVYVVRENWINVGDGECSKGYDCPACNPTRCEFYHKDVAFRGCEIRQLRVLTGITDHASNVAKQIGKELFLTEEDARAKASEIEAALSAGKGE